MQGCNMHCTFCIVPRRAERNAAAPSPTSSRSSRARRPGREGSHPARPNRESVWPARICGARRQEPLRAIARGGARVDGLERLRFTSPHPIGFRDDLIDAFARLAKARRACASAAAIGFESHSQSDASCLHRGEICRPGRPNSRRQTRIALTTDVIVGFPGETMTITADPRSGRTDPIR